MSEFVVQEALITAEIITDMSPLDYYGVKSIRFIKCQAQEQVWAKLIEILSKTKIKKIDFRKCNIGRANQFDEFANKQPKLTKAEQALAQLKQITSLTLWWCKLSPQVIQQISSLPRLQELNILINNLRKIDSLNKLTRLKRVYIQPIPEEQYDIFNYPMFYGAKLEYLNTTAPKYLGNVLCSFDLKELKLTHCKNYGQKQCSLISRMQKLEKLHISGSFKQEDWFWFICQLVNLTHLTIHNFQNDRYAKQSSITQIEEIKQLSKLVQLTIESQFQGNKTQAISSLPELKQLNLYSLTQRNTDKIGDKDCFELSKLSKLRKLYLDNNWISIAGVQFLSILTNLEVLSLSNHNYSHLLNLNVNTQYFGDQGAKIISKLSKLRELSIQNNNIENEGVAALCRGNCQLEFLNLNDNMFGNQGIFQIRKLSKLKKLRVRNHKIDSNGYLFLDRMNHLDSIGIHAKFSQKKILKRLKNQQSNVEWIDGPDFMYEP